MAENINFDDIPAFAPLGLIAISGSEWMAKLVEKHIQEQRNTDEEYIIKAQFIYSGTGECRCDLMSSVRGKDIYIFADVTNYSVTFKMRDFENHMSPDNHYQNLKRIISAIENQAARVTVIMPFLYESRQHRRTGRETLDAASALAELGEMGVNEVITFDAHDPRVSNSIPLIGFTSYMPTYRFFQSIYDKVENLPLTADKLMIISPDEGATDRALELATLLNVDIGTFYKRRDYSKVVNGTNPIVAHEFLGRNVDGKTVIIVDDMISSGGSMIDTCKHLKELGSKQNIICSTFGLFNSGLEIFDEAYKDGILDYVCTTNLNYRDPALLTRPWYIEADESIFLATIIQYGNHNTPIPESLLHVSQINDFVNTYVNDGYQYFNSII